MRHAAPMDARLVGELFEFWLPIFEGALDVTPEALLGDEGPDSRVVVHTRRIGGYLAGACLVVSSASLPVVGGLGEVGTSPAARRSGIATALTQQALEDFSEHGGQALFLGTVNPAAARIYHRLGWRKLAGANLMLNALNGGLPEEFLVDYFRGVSSEPVAVREPSPADRASMIPLLAMPHDWQALDFNTGMFSTRYAALDSCLGLYRRYNAVARDGRGAWFCASTDAGQVVGLSTARLVGDGGCRVDGFTHRYHLGAMEALVRAAVGWGGDRGVGRIYVDVSVEDEEKRALFESIGFIGAGEGKRFDLNGRQVDTLRLEFALSVHLP